MAKTLQQKVVSALSKADLTLSCACLLYTSCSAWIKAFIHCS